MFTQRDWLLDQIDRLAAALAERVIRTRDDEQEVDQQCAAAVGLGLDSAERLPAPVLVHLLTTADGVDHPRLLALALGLAVRCVGLRSRGGDDEELAGKALELARVALAGRPDLDGPEVRRALQALDRGRPGQ